MPNTHGRKPPNPQSVRVPRGARQKPPPPPARGGRPTVDGCPMAIPVAVALLPYAMVRLAIDTWRNR